MSRDYLGLSGADYDDLYARYLTRNLDRLIEAAGSVEGKRVLDLCTGSGIVAKRARELGASWVMGVDESEDMTKDIPVLPTDGGLDFVCNASIGADFNRIICWDYGVKFDIVICRQAVNYWWSRKNLEDILGVIDSKGCFVFNTFHGDNWINPKSPSVKKYILNSVMFVEVVWLIRDVVYHVQILEGYPPHFTKFRYINRDEYINDIESLCSVNKWSVERYNNTDIYVIEKV